MAPRTWPVAHVHTDELTCIPGDLQQDGRLAAARGPSPDLVDEPGTRQLGDHVRHGRAGELGAARDVRAADGPEVGERPQHEPHVVLSCRLMRRLGRQLHRRSALLRQSDPSRREARCPVPGPRPASACIADPAVPTWAATNFAKCLDEHDVGGARTFVNTSPEVLRPRPGARAKGPGPEVAVVLAGSSHTAARRHVTRPILRDDGHHQRQGRIVGSGPHRAQDAPATRDTDPVQHAADEAARLLRMPTAPSCTCWTRTARPCAGPPTRASATPRSEPGCAQLVVPLGVGMFGSARSPTGRSASPPTTPRHHVPACLDDRPGRPGHRHPLDGRGAASSTATSASARSGVYSTPPGRDGRAEATARAGARRPRGCDARWHARAASTSSPGPREELARRAEQERTLRADHGAHRGAPGADRGPPAHRGRVAAPAAARTART